MARGDITALTISADGAAELLNYVFSKTATTYNIRVGYQINGVGTTIFTTRQSINSFKSAATSSKGITIGGFAITDPIPEDAHLNRIEISIGTTNIFVIRLTSTDVIIFDEEALLFVENISIGVQGV